MTERIKKPGAASHTAARRLGGATGDARAPQNSSEERESHACACATPYWRGAETLRGKLRSSLSSRGKPGPPSRGPAVRPAVSTPSLSTPLPLSSGHARRAAPPAIYGRRAGVRCARIYAWGSGDLRDQAADGRRSRYSPLTSYLTLPFTPRVPRWCNNVVITVFVSGDGVHSHCEKIAQEIRYYVHLSQRRPHLLGTAPGDATPHTVTEHPRARRGGRTARTLGVG